MVRDIRGLGLMIAVELRTKVAPVLKSLMLNHGVIALPAGPTVLRLLPPLVITEKEINLGVQAIAKAIKELRLTAALMDRAAAIELVRGLVAIPSLSRHEAAACIMARRADARRRLRSRVRRRRRKRRGRARRSIRPADDRPSRAHRHRPRQHSRSHRGREGAKAEGVLFGRGSVDAKGPLATFAAGAARFGSAAAKAAGLRIVVVGAVEEEAATSKGARFIASRFDGNGRADPGRVHHRRAESLESRHAWLQGTAAARLHRRSADGPHRRSRCERRVGRGGLLELGHRARRAVNDGKDKVFDQLSPSLRRFITSTNDADARHRRRAVRLAPAGRLRRRAFMNELADRQQANRPSGNRPQANRPRPPST